MVSNPFLGVFFHWLGGLASGSFYVPYRGVRKWSWEVYWLVGGFFSRIIMPWLLASLLTNDLPGVLRERLAAAQFTTQSSGPWSPTASAGTVAATAFRFSRIFSFGTLTHFRCRSESIIFRS